MTTLLFGIEPHDPTVFVLVSLTLVAVGLCACWLPARRAAAVPAVQALAQDDRGA